MFFSGSAKTTFCHLIHQGYSESLTNGMSMVIKYDRKEMVVLYDFSRRREGERDSETLDRYSEYFAFAKMKSATSTCSRIPIRVIKYLSLSSIEFAVMLLQCYLKMVHLYIHVCKTCMLTMFTSIQRIDYHI